jgi:hypothetical protein
VNPLIRSSAAALLLSFAAVTAAQPAGIYTCVDAKGRKITSDRPIVDCIDREQVELNPSGTVRRKVGPSLTAQERAAEEAKEREAAEERARRVEEKRRDHALLVRYPYRSVHDAERREALAQIDVVIKAAQQRLTELQQQRNKIDTEMEFYKKDPSRAPPSLRRQTEDNIHSTDVQIRFIADQEEEKKRVNERFNEDLVKLQKFWTLSPQRPGAETSRTDASKPAR